MGNPIFEANPSLDCYFEAGDGSCFFTENAAESHARTLADKKVKTIRRPEAVASVEVPEPTEAVAPDEAKVNTKKK